MREMSFLDRLLDGVAVEWKPLDEVFDIFAGGDVPKDALSNFETEEFSIPNLSYAYYFMKTIESQYKVPKAGIPQFMKPMLKDIKMPLPCPGRPEKSLTEQARIVAILDKFDALTNSITEGLPREIELRQKQYAHYRDLLLGFPKLQEVVV